MRWERLFEDLEAQLAAARTREDRAGLVELVRAERASTHVADRLRASAGRALHVDVGGGPDEQWQAAGELVEWGRDWLLLAQGVASRALIPWGAVQAITGLAEYTAPPDRGPAALLGLPHALRALSRDRVEVTVFAGARTFAGRLDRVGADYVDVTPDAGSSRTVPLAAVRMVRSK